MAAHLSPPAFVSHAVPALIGAAVAGVGSISQEQVAQWVGLALMGWSGLLAGYDAFRASRRRNERADLDAELVYVRAKIAAARSELSGLEIRRNQVFVEEGR